MSGKAPKKPQKKRPRDVNQLAKSIVDIATDQTAEDIPTQASGGKDPAAVSLGRRGGLKGGAARALKLSPDQRKLIAKKAAAARWKKDDG